MRLLLRALVLLLAPLPLLLLPLSGARAHQPFFEEQDLERDSPWHVGDPRVSTVVYASLEPAGDIDFYRLRGEAGQEVLLEVVIPQIPGQEDFAPALALLGPGLPPLELPDSLRLPAEGGLAIPPPDGPPQPFFEPFSRTSYWERQSRRVTLPAEGTYEIVVWHPDRVSGRYALVVGDREVPGGDPDFAAKLRRYWVPVGSAPAAPGLVEVALWAIGAYLLGGVPFALVLGRLFAGVDIRHFGDGNPGAANAWRAAGWQLGLPALLLDGLKGALPVFLARYLAGLDGWPLAAVALAPILGHVLSPYLRFRGGKGLAVTFGVWTGLTFATGPLILGALLTVLYFNLEPEGWVVVGGTLGLTLALAWLGASAPTLAVAAATTLILAWTYRQALAWPPRRRRSGREAAGA